VHSIDCLVDSRGAVHSTPVIDVLTGHDVGQAHFGHVMRKADSCLAQPLHAQMREIAIRALGALVIRGTSTSTALSSKSSSRALRSFRPPRSE
jgi:hypothetical protein